MDEFNKFLNENSTDIYEELLLGPLSIVYTAINKGQLNSWQSFATHLIDKFAIHSASYFHLSNGIIELKKSTEKVKMHGYDLFSVHSLFRSMMETYATFNHIYVEPEMEDEKHFRFLLWKIDGLSEKQKFNIDGTEYEGAKNDLEKDKENLNNTVLELERNSYFINATANELIKVYNPEKRKYNWRFKSAEGKIKPLTIMALVEDVFRTKGFINLYRYSSSHTHSQYLALEHFSKQRGKPIPEDFVQNQLKFAIFMTSMMIYDICKISNEAKTAYRDVPEQLKWLINWFATAIKKE